MIPDNYVLEFWQPHCTKCNLRSNGEKVTLDLQIHGEPADYIRELILDSVVHDNARHGRTGRGSPALSTWSTYLLWQNMDGIILLAGFFWVVHG